MDAPRQPFKGIEKLILYPDLLCQLEKEAIGYKRRGDFFILKCFRHTKNSVKVVLDPSMSHNKQGIAETAKTNGPTCDNMCIQKIK